MCICICIHVDVFISNLLVSQVKLEKASVILHKWNLYGYDMGEILFVLCAGVSLCSLCYVWDLVSVMCSLQSVLCAVFFCVMCGI